MLNLENDKIIINGEPRSFIGKTFTKSRRLVDLYATKPENIFVDDIAHSLAHQSRWNGMTDRFFSAAQHSCIAYDISKSSKALALFFKIDAAYFGEFSISMERILETIAPQLIEARENFRQLVWDKYAIPTIERRYIETIYRQLNSWDLDHLFEKNNLELWSPSQAKKEFLQRFDEAIKPNLI